MKRIPAFIQRALTSIFLSTQSVNTTNRISMNELPKSGTTIIVGIFRVIFHFDLFRLNSVSSWSAQPLLGTQYKVLTKKQKGKQTNFQLLLAQ